MNPPAPPHPLLADLKELPPARVALGRSGASLPTSALLGFTLDHARARDAVHAAFDAPALIAGLGELGVRALGAASRASSRSEYLRRPDLGRRLDPDCAQRLAGRAEASPGRVAVVV